MVTCDNLLKIVGQMFVINELSIWTAFYVFLKWRYGYIDKSFFVFFAVTFKSYIEMHVLMAVVSILTAVSFCGS